MPVSTIECPECQKVLRTSTELTPGKKIRCPKCQAVFPVPEEEERPRSAIRSKNGANGSARKRPVDDDEEGFEDRRGRRNGSTAGMGARKRSRDDDDDYDRDMDDEDERPRRKKKAKSGGLMLGLIIGGAAFLLLGGFALTAFVWPGFLRSSGASAPGGGQDPFAFMPARSDIVMGVNADAMFKVPGFRQGFEQGVQMGNPLPPGAIELVRNADRVVIGVDSSSESVVVAILTKNAVEADKIRQTFQAGPAKTIQGKTCYPLQHGEGYVTLPNSRLILVCKMPDNELGALLNSDGKTNRLNPDMQNQVRAHENSLLYFLVGMSPKLQQSIKGAALFIPPGKGGKQNDLAALLPLLERCKSVTASMDLINKDVQFKASLSCATDADASQCRNSLEKAWNEQGKPAVQKEGKAFTGLTDDLIKTLKFQTQGPMVNVSLQISENTLKELEKLGGPPGMPPGGFQPGGFQGGKGFQGGMPGNFQGGIPGNFQGGKGVQGGVPGNFQGGIPGNFQGGKGPPGNFQGGIPGNFQGGAPDPSGKK
ncbi:MAG TPA: hypothetical protein VKE98_06835 [Gemmataceae bacterium]|nr:hypothetical protein [Gemmataceae bacterium]